VSELEAMFVEAQAEGEFATFDARIMAATVLTALEGVPRELLSRPDLDAGEYGRELADLFERATSKRRRLRR
jgi:hypothetical protein